MICFSFWRQRVVNHDMDAIKMVAINFDFYISGLRLPVTELDESRCDRVLASFGIMSAY